MLKYCLSGKQCFHPSGPFLNLSEFAHPSDLYCKVCLSANLKTKRKKSTLSIRQKVIKQSKLPPGVKMCSREDKCLHPNGPLLPFSEFHIDNSCKDGLRGVCKICKKEDDRLYRLEHKEQKRENNKRYRAAHKDYLQERGRIYRQENKEYYQEYGRKYRITHKEQHAEHSRNYYWRHRERVLERERIWRQEHPIITVKRPTQTIEERRAKRRAHYLSCDKEELRTYNRERYWRNPDKDRLKRQRRRARKRELPDTLTHEQWQACLEYFDNACVYCGSTASLHLEHYIPLTSKECPGTVATNVLPACESCNSSKSNKPAADWLISKFGAETAFDILDRIENYFSSL